MSDQTAAPPVSLSAGGHELERVSQRKRVVRRFFRHRMAVTGGAILLGIFLTVTLGTLVYSEADSLYNDTSLRLLPPSSAHPFGTDTIGRDILARTIYGGQISLIIGVPAVIVSITLG